TIHGLSLPMLMTLYRYSCVHYDDTISIPLPFDLVVGYNPLLLNDSDGVDFGLLMEFGSKYKIKNFHVEYELSQPSDQISKQIRNVRQNSYVKYEATATCFNRRMNWSIMIFPIVAMFFCITQNGNLIKNKIVNFSRLWINELTELRETIFCDSGF